MIITLCTLCTFSAHTYWTVLREIGLTVVSFKWSPECKNMLHGFRPRSPVTSVVSTHLTFHSGGVNTCLEHAQCWDLLPIQTSVLFGDHVIFDSEIQKYYDCCSYRFSEWFDSLSNSFTGWVAMHGCKNSSLKGQSSQMYLTLCLTIFHLSLKLLNSDYCDRSRRNSCAANVALWRVKPLGRAHACRAFFWPSGTWGEWGNASGAGSSCSRSDWPRARRRRRRTAASWSCSACSSSTPTRWSTCASRRTTCTGTRRWRGRTRWAGGRPAGGAHSAAVTWSVPEPCSSLSFSPTSRWTRACTGAFRPGWTRGPKSTWPVTWLPRTTSGWWEKDEKICCPAPPPAVQWSCIISPLTSTGWSTRRRSHTEPSCHWWISRFPSSLHWVAKGLSSTIPKR